MGQCGSAELRAAVYLDERHPETDTFFAGENRGRELSAAPDERLRQRALRFGLPWQNPESERLQVLAQLFDRLKADCADPASARLL